ncbi:NUDIX domain-containing protein [Mucilaginibacter segetis]|uniref:NUDIX domain-containing protein n=1 Tax=Mucilaginibacter segetis TaxID=2793071 RepID=A0A934PTG2_9SPHI|nr:NUDIX domain-containing protein [Mucilaginibacter segetis]MBK0379110.1 NUDIX domain-containing protein [Mucilaginibacter segetis]
MSNKPCFNVRVYGLLINNNNELLISDEQEYGMRFSKFPGGGLEYGEGLIEGLKREFMEECNMSVEITAHFYTTDFFVKSAFNDSQLISVYYRVKNTSDITFAAKTLVFDFDGEGDILQSFRWVKLSDLKPCDLTFPIDQYVAELLIKEL